MTSSSNAYDLAGRVDAELSSIVTSREMPLYRMMAYHMGWDGGDELSDLPAPRPRTHGVLCLLACRAAGGDIDASLPAAAAVELVYSFCQIHDDVQGGKPKRDNRDAVWWVWGPAQAINAGDGMHALARLALFRLPQRGVASATTFVALKLLDEASLRTCEGRFLDLEAQERIDISVDAYLDTVDKKTGALAGCAMRLGGLVATESTRVHDALATCGQKLGAATQIRDDLRQFWSEEEEGGPPSPEVLNKKKLLPVVYALENATVGVKRRLGDIYFKRVLEAKDVEAVRQILDELGVRKHCEELVENFGREALSALNVPGISEQGRAEIEEFLTSLLE